MQLWIDLSIILFICTNKNGFCLQKQVIPMFSFFERFVCLLFVEKGTDCFLYFLDQIFVEKYLKWYICHWHDIKVVQYEEKSKKYNQNQQLNEVTNSHYFKLVCHTELFDKLW